MHNKTFIKICGVRDAEIAAQIGAAGADFIGIIFHPKSARFVQPEVASSLVQSIKSVGAKPVGVFTQHTAEEIKTICSLLNIDIVQLHGTVARQTHHLLPQHFQRVYVLSVDQEGKIAADTEVGVKHCDPMRDFLLFDYAIPGSGTNFPWQQFKYDHSFRWFLAGGLTAQNVTTALQLLQPTGVDVSSGVEKEVGKKDIILVREFITKVNQYDAT